MPGGQGGGELLWGRWGNYHMQRDKGAQNPNLFFHFQSFAARGVCPAAGELRNGDSAKQLQSGKNCYRISEK